MAYKQPRVPPMREGAQLAQYMRELVLFLKDFSLETWQAVRRMQEAESILRAETTALMSAQAQALRGEMETMAENATRAAIDGALPVGVVMEFGEGVDPGALYPWQTWAQNADTKRWQRTA